jgi:hypothetical protein
VVRFLVVHTAKADHTTPTNQVPGNTIYTETAEGLSGELWRSEEKQEEGERACNYRNSSSREQLYYRRRHIRKSGGDNAMLD